MSNPEYFAIMMGRFYRHEPVDTIRTLTSATVHRRSSKKTRKRWMDHAEFAANQFCIVEKETADTIAKNAQAVDGMRIGLSAISNKV